MPSISYDSGLSTSSTNGASLVPWPGSSSPNIRSGYDILWSCLVTTFACVYTALHMNIPSLQDSKWTRLRRKIKWVSINFVTPEAIAFNALRGYSAARRYNTLFQNKTKCTSEEWNLTHSFYSTMGGFLVTLPNRDKFPALPDEIATLVEQKLVSLPIVTKRQIEDKSKTDYLGKAFASSQVLWFANNLISRASQGF